MEDAHNPSREGTCCSCKCIFKYDNCNPFGALMCSTCFTIFKNCDDIGRKNM